MKKVIFSWLLSAMFVTTAMAQFGATRTGFEGDNFSLEGALELFKDSRSVQDFERRLNTRTNWVNNLDLDYNGRTDYIRVNHRRQGSLNAIILQVPVDRRYVQDIAVIQIEQTGRRRALLQMVGDADLYGQNVVVEPYDQFGGTVNVYRWRAVRNILDGFGSPYASPYAFNNYPVWYSPWDQYAWSAYQPRFATYGRYYRVSPINRLSNVYGFYSPYRTYCPTISNRTARIRSQRPATNTATTTRSTTTRTRNTAATSSRATTTRSATRATTQTRANTTRARATTQSRANTSRTRATTQPRRTTSRATTTTRNTSSTRGTATPTTRSTRQTTTRTTRPTTTRATSPRARTTTPRTSRATTTRATSQPRRTATPSRSASSTTRKSTAPTKRATSTRSTSKRSGVK